jgi:hypothetical protein
MLKGPNPVPGGLDCVPGGKTDGGKRGTVARGDGLFFVSAKSATEDSPGCSEAEPLVPWEPIITL